MHDDEKHICWATAQIRQMANEFQGKRLPDWAVGAIEGWCNKIDRDAPLPVGGEDASGWTGADKHNPYRRS